METKRVKFNVYWLSFCGSLPYYYVSEDEMETDSDRSVISLGHTWIDVPDLTVEQIDQALKGEVIKTLEMKKNELLAKTELEVKHLDEKISSLLAIENKG